ncbi:MAG: Rdx family protein [Actinomycetota bacterium]
MTERILSEFEFDISDITLIPSRGGAFEVVLGDDLIYSKKETGRHAEPDEILKNLRAKIR